MSLPDEVCQECGKTISRRGFANVFDDRVVCTACYKTLAGARKRQQRVAEREEARKRRAEEAAEAAGRARAEWLESDHEPATDRQTAYARDLGMTFPPGVTKRVLSAMIDARLKGPAPARFQEEAAALGVRNPDAMAAGELKPLVRRRKVTRTWAYSVVRHMLKANWVYFDDSGLALATLRPVIDALAEDGAAIEAIEDQEFGWDDEYEDFCAEHGTKADLWFFFGPDGPSPATDLYRRTRDLVTAHIGRHLPALPRHVRPTPRRGREG